ncbi:hypothetical protein N7456_001619 [Penicillium angulare]|uniref:Uncharacterized protein n=1 Tax=Penicillium angulare TaxID=116970 RepID=A0A9W9KP07_9EURO|nr:hypothetical protein N7456_001619 [Penicillium angulare]
MIRTYYGLYGLGPEHFRVTHIWAKIAGQGIKSHERHIISICLVSKAAGGEPNNWVPGLCTFVFISGQNLQEGCLFVEVQDDERENKVRLVDGLRGGVGGGLDWLHGSAVIVP